MGQPPSFFLAECLKSKFEQEEDQGNGGGRNGKVSKDGIFSVLSVFLLFNFKAIDSGKNVEFL